MILTKANSSQESKEIEKLKALLPQKKRGVQLERLLIGLYPVLNRVPVIRNLLLRIRKRLLLIHAGVERSVRAEAAKLTVLAISIFLIAIICSVIFPKSIFTTMGIWVGGIYLGGAISDIWISRIEHNMMLGFVELLDAIRFEYQKFKMVKEAVQEASENSDKLISAHAEQYVDILESIDPEMALRKYYEIAPNHFARQVAGVCWIVSELGDTVSNGASSFLSALTKIQDEIRLDILRREHLFSQLKGLEAICIVPILFLEPMRKWSEVNFPFMKDFYVSQLGILAVFIPFILTIISFYSLRMFRTLDNSVQNVADVKTWMNRLIAQKVFSKLLDRITPNENEKTHFKAKRRLAFANSHYSVRELYARKFLFAAVIGLVTVSILIYSHMNVRYHLMHPLPVVESDGKVSDVIMKRLEFESEMYKRFYDKDIYSDEAQADLRYSVDHQAYKVSTDEVNGYLTALSQKIASYQKEVLQWYEILISFVTSCLSYRIPEVLLFFRKYMRDLEMQHEVDRFYSMISILAVIPRISVIEILEWMHRNSIIFEKQLQSCILDYGSGDSLERFKQEVNFRPMEQLVERLKEAAENIPVAQAFDNIEGERAFAIRRREQRYQEMTAIKVAWAKQIGFMPMYVSVGIYLVFPIAYVAYLQLNVVLTDLPM
ncbi:hypothetical protein FPZ49_24555 [Paenibacillus cremeus]|uniref:Uncharacterized protein n=1 Tax=Paenibacillus cremeus TaxID=2163881 RepID=A0A559K597_9BACL|nr:hypothetical protein FPZ49_24555 [Paenibacillus cremeus]